MPNGKTAPGPKPRSDVIDPATGEVLNGKPKEKPPSDSRLAIPQPARRGGNRPKHRQIIANAVIAGQGLSIVLDEISTLDGSLDAAEAGRLASDLSTVIRSLKRIQSLLTKEV